MNTLLQNLFEKYEISEKDKYGISQIYNLLPDNKKKNIINNFENIAYKVKKIEEDLLIEKEIILGNALEIVKNAIIRYKNERLKIEL